MAGVGRVHGAGVPHPIAGFTVTIAGITPIAEMTDATAARLKLDVDEFRRLSAEANPVKRVGLPEDIAAAVVFLCSPGAAYVTGATLHVNGGMFMD